MPGENSIRGMLPHWESIQQLESDSKFIQICRLRDDH